MANYSEIFSSKSAFGRLLIAYLFLGILVGLSGVYFYNQMQSLQTETEDLEKNHLLLRQYIYELKSEINQWLYLNTQYIYSNDKAINLHQKANWENKVIPTLDSIIKHESIVNFPKNQQKIIEIKKMIIQLPDLSEKLYKSGKKAEVNTKLNLQSIKINKNIDDFIALQKMSIKKSFANIEKNLMNVSLTLWIILSLGGMISFLFTWWLFSLIFKNTNKFAFYIRTLIDGNLPKIEAIDTQELVALNNAIIDLKSSFTRLKKMAEEIGGGYFDTSTTMFAGKGEMGAALKAMRESLTYISRQNWERNFFNEGFAKFSEILRNSARQSEQVFYDSIISNLVRYLNVAQGGIFAIQESNKNKESVMILKSSYAYERKKSIKKEITPEDGLIGQVWRERETVYINDIPEDYSEITSSIGQAKPKSILVVPLISNDYLNGIIELTSFREFENYQIEFVKRLSESISSTIARLQVDEESRRTSEEAKLLTAKMQAQEEQMKQTLSALADAQKMMEQKNIEMENQLKALEESFIYLEITPQGNISFANKIMEEVSGYSQDELLGQSFKFLMGKRSEDDLVRRDWQRILNGHQVKGEFVRYGKNNQKYWTQEVIYPLRNADNKIYKIIAIGYDITKQKLKEFDVQNKLAELQMSKRDVVKRIKEVENKSKAKIQQMQQDFFVQLKEKDKIIENLKNNTK
jgi:PAS domain S-box-containing protein